MDKPWKVIFAFVGVFIAGSVFGGLLTMRVGGRILWNRGVFAQNDPHNPNAHPGVNGSPQQPPGNEGPRRNFMPLQATQVMRRYANKLDLTADQKEKINPIIVRATEDLRRQQQTSMRETSVVLERLNADMRSLLTPDQIVRLDKMEQETKDTIQKQRQNFNEGMPNRKEQRANGERPYGGKFGPKGEGDKAAPPEGTPPPAPAPVDPSKLP